MPRQVDQLPTDATSLVRRIQALERQVTELRAARRLTSATVGTVRTAPDGARVELRQDSQSLQVYGDDGETLLAELGPEASGGGGLWTRGLQSPYNMSAYLGSGELSFRPVQNGLVALPAAVTYDTDSTQYADLILSSGALGGTDKPARVLLESVFGAGNPWVYVTGAQSGQCNMDVNGILLSRNIAFGSVTITPSAANTPTSANVTGLNLKGSTFLGFSGAQTSRPGSTTTPDGVTGTGTTSVTSTGLTVWLTRQNTTATTVNWLVMGT